MSTFSKSTGTAGLTLLQRGKPGHSSAFCFPGAGASVSCFIPILSLFDPDATIYGIEPRGLDGLQAPYTSVEAAAADCLVPIREVTQNCEVHLIGHSFGGWLAFELGCLMEKVGKSPDMLTLLDTEPPGSDELAFESDLDSIASLISLYEQKSEVPFQPCSNDFRFRSETLDAQLEEAFCYLRANGAIPARLSVGEFRHVFRAFAESARIRYRPKATLGARAALVHPTDLWDGGKPVNALEVEFRKWRLFVPNIQRTTCPGNHITMLQSVSAIQLGISGFSSSEIGQ